MKKTLIPLFLLLSACTTVPVAVTAKFPPAPDELKKPCPNLTLLQKDSKLSDVMVTVTENYVKYHDCSAKVDAWNDWYKSQKEIFEKATKN